MTNSKITLTPVGSHVRTLEIHDCSPDAVRLVITMHISQVDTLRRASDTDSSKVVDIPFQLTKSDVRKIAAWTKAS